MTLKTVSNKKAFVFIGLLSLAAFIFLVWLIYIKEKPAQYSEQFTYLPLVNSCLNAISASCLCFGLFFIKKGDKTKHAVSMISAFVVSSLFLITYIVYHSVHGDTHFLKQGLIRPIYFFTLISHISLTLVGLPFILTTFWLAFKQNFNTHKKLARYTFPIWLYISVTGVLIYLLQL